MLGFCSIHLCGLLLQKVKRNIYNFFTSAPCTCADCFFGGLLRLCRQRASAPCTCADCFGRNAQTMKHYRSNSVKATAQMHGYISNPSKHLALLCLKRYQICSFSSVNPHGQAWVLDVRTRRGGDRPPTTIFFISVIWLFGYLVVWDV